MDNQRRHFSAALSVAISSFILIGGLIFFYMNRSQQIWEKDERTRLIRLLNNKRSNLENELYARIYYTKSVAAYVSLRPEISNEEYYNLAAELIQYDPIISTMALSKGGTINAIYPLEGHESVIGLDLLAHPERREIVEQTIETGKTFVGGPVELVEGGIAFISYTPIFDKTKAAPHPFWGMTDIVIKKPELIAAAKIKERESNASFAIRGYNGLGDQGDVFFGEASVFDQDPVKVSAQLPDGEWVLAAIPQAGWAGYLDQDRILLIVFIGSGLIISILLGLFASAMYRIRHDALQMKSIFRAMTGVVIEFDHDDTIVWVGATQQKLPSPLNNLQIGERLSNSLPPLSKATTEQIEASFVEQQISSFEFEIKQKSGSRWMLATLSPNGAGHLIMVIQEITLQKEQQNELARSESELKRLNADKNKLFSIIAHDLRTPLTGITGLSDHLLRHRDLLSPEEEKEFVELIYQSGKENLLLLENLLSWAQSQQSGLEARIEPICLDELVKATLTIFRELAKHKGIELINEVPDETAISFDRSMMETILRNLIANAIKFSSAGSQVIVGIQKKADHEIELFVKDHGVGMSEEMIHNILNTGSASSTRGTADESGSGLGLQLCLEFLKKHGQELQITSKRGVGTTMQFKLKKTV